MTEPLAVLVNGLPGSGKTTLARTLARHLGLPLFSKDVIKEAHADVLGTEQADASERAAVGVAGYVAAGGVPPQGGRFPDRGGGARWRRTY